jgi:hypothetical protein
MHPRKAIRKAFEARLKSQDTAAQTRVYSGRVAPVSEEELYEDGPAILIYTREQKSYEYAVDGEDSQFKSCLYIVTEGMVAGGETVDDALDDLAEQIEAAFDNWDIPGHESAKIRMHESAIDLVTETFRRPIGAVGITWEITFMSPWRITPPGTRPHDVSVSIDGGPPELIIKNDERFFP